MRTRKLGPDGPEVSAIGLGGMWMSITGRPEESQSIATIQASIDAGVNFIDTADVYCLDDDDLGHNERLIAKALQGRREHVTVATKGGLRRPKGAWERDGRPEQLIKACEQSLKALGVEVIDLYQLHAPSPNVPFTESLGALIRLREQGKIRFVGLSNVEPKHIEVARALVPIQSVQNRWNSNDRAPEHGGVIAACEKHGIAFLPYSPFGGANGAPNLAQTGSLGAEAERRKMSPHRLILAWMLAKSPVVIPIPGARRSESAIDSAAAADVDLSTEDVAAIEASFGSKASAK